MPRQPEQSVVGSRPFRELDGPEAAVVWTQDLIDRLDRMLHDPRFRERVEEVYIKSGRFGTGACFPVMKVKGQLEIKVYTSLEGYRSNEKMPPPFVLPIEVQVGEDVEDPQGVLSATMRVEREVGVSVETSVDQARLDTGLEVLAPVRDETGYVKNREVPESQSNPKSRKAKAKQAAVEESADEESVA